MAAAQPCTSSSAQASDNRIYLFRLQILIIDGGLTVLRNYVDQILTAKSMTLSACLAKENTTITRLRGRGTITKAQYALLFPSSGNISTSDLDITLIICLLRNLKCFGLNSKFNWSIQPGQNDLSIEADMYRLKSYRNKMCHISTTTGIQLNDFKTMWRDIKQILLRVNVSSGNPLTDLKQKITDFKSSPLDSEAEERMKNEIKKWTQHEKAVEVKLELVTKDVKEVKDILGTQTKRQAKTHKRTLKNAKDVKIAKSKIAKIEKQIPAGNKITSLNECLDINDQAVNEERYQQRKKDFKEDLMRFYKWSHSKVCLSPLFEEKDTPLASFYIRPELNVYTLQKMFKTGGVANREIYLKADAGLGKTTFSKYLATSWYQAHCPDEIDLQYFEKNDIDCMRDFDFVFLVLLRDSNTSCSVDELIFKLIVSKLANSKSFTEIFLEKLMSREKCLVILDGLDEWTHPNRQCERAPRSVPHRNVRENCTILTTTRPWKLGDLNLSSNELGITVELTKLNYYSARLLIRRALLRLKSPPHNMSIEIDDATLVNEIFNSRVAYLAYVPLLLMYMICLRCEGFNIGHSKCELYVKIVELLLLRTTQKYGDIAQTLSASGIPACFTERDKCKKYFPLLVNLGQLAYHTLFNETRENRLVFDGSVTEKYLTPEEMEFTLHSGILSQSTTTTLTKKFSKVSFSHKTVQEFFAAIFISFENEAQKIVLEKCRNIRDIPDMSIHYEFVIEMNADRLCAISYDLMSVINEDEETRGYRTRTRDGRMYRLGSIQERFMSRTGYEKLDDISPLYDIQERFMSRTGDEKSDDTSPLYEIQERFMSRAGYEMSDDISPLYEIQERFMSRTGYEKSDDISPLYEIQERFLSRTGYEKSDDISPLYDIQEMFMSWLQKMPEGENIQLCLQDFFIDRNTVHRKQLQRLLKQNKTNIKSLYINTDDTSSSLCEIIDLFSLTDLSHIQKLFYRGDMWEEAEINRILFPSLQSVTLLYGEWTNDEENLNENLARLQNLQYLYIAGFMLSHKILEKIFNFISGQKSMKELTLDRLCCKEHEGDRWNLDLSQHSTLSKLDLWMLSGRLHLNISTPSLVDVRLENINLDESSLFLSHDMLNIKVVKLLTIEMSAGSLQNFMTVLEDLPQSVTVKMWDIRPETEYERVRENIRTSHTFQVIKDEDDNDLWELKFKTSKPKKE